MLNEDQSEADDIGKDDILSLTGELKRIQNSGDKNIRNLSLRYLGVLNNLSRKPSLSPEDKNVLDDIVKFVDNNQEGSQDNESDAPDPNQDGVEDAYGGVSVGNGRIWNATPK